MNSHGGKANQELQDAQNMKQGDADPTDPEKRADQLEDEIEEIRDNLGGLVTELDHRRHRLNPLNALEQYPWAIAIGGVVLVGAAWGGIALHNARERERSSWRGRSKQLQATLGRAVDRPDKGPGAGPNVGMKVLTAACTAAAAVVARRLVTRFLTPPPRR
ncbi:MAG: hypothetical protein H7X95_13640 [Deltaproteobacteria bacterium]|nr:hypothetical protein [Deltaproteobacteria bacterium]